MAWTIASLIALIASLALLSQMFFGTIWHWDFLTATCLVIISQPLQGTLYLGQFNCFLLLFLTIACFAQRRGAAWSAGAFVALATYLKLFPGLFFVALLLKRDYKPFTAGLVWLVALGLLGVLVLGVSNHIDYVLKAAPSVSHHVAFWHNHSLPGFWRKLFNPGRPNITPLWRSSALEWIALAGSWSVVILLLWQAARTERHDPGGLATFSLTMVAIVLMAPVTWNHYFLMLLLPIAWLHSRIPSFSWTRLCFLFCVVLLCITPGKVLRWTLFRGGSNTHFDAFDTATVISIQLYGGSKAKIQAVAMEMSPASSAAVRAYLPEAKIVFDRFPAIKRFNEKLTALRRALYLRGDRRDGQADPQGDSVAAAEVRGEPRRRQDGRKEEVGGGVVAEPAAGGGLYYLKEELRQFWEQSSKELATAFLDGGIKCAAASGIKILKGLAKTLAAHRSGLLNDYNVKITSGPMEGTNNKIKTMKRQAYGYRDKEFFKLKILAIHESKCELVG
jgi:hypothetical protein